MAINMRDQPPHLPIGTGDNSKSVKDTNSAVVMGRNVSSSPSLGSSLLPSSETINEPPLQEANLCDRKAEQATAHQIDEQMDCYAEEELLKGMEGIEIQSLTERLESEFESIVQQSTIHTKNQSHHDRIRAKQFNEHIEQHNRRLGIKQISHLKFRQKRIQKTKNQVEDDTFIPAELNYKNAELLGFLRKCCQPRICNHASDNLLSTVKFWLSGPESSLKNQLYRDIIHSIETISDFRKVLHQNHDIVNGEINNLDNIKFKSKSIYISIPGSKTEIKGCKHISFRGASLTGTEFRRVPFIQCNFNEANLSHTKFYSCHFHQCTFDSANFTGAHLGTLCFKSSTLTNITPVDILFIFFNDCPSTTVKSIDLWSEAVWDFYQKNRVFPINTVRELIEEMADASNSEFIDNFSETMESLNLLSTSDRYKFINLYIRLIKSAHSKNQTEIANIYIKRLLNIGGDILRIHKNTFLMVFNLFSSTNLCDPVWFLNLAYSSIQQDPSVSRALARHYNSHNEPTLALDTINQTLTRVNFENCSYEFIHSIIRVLNEVNATLTNFHHIDETLNNLITKIEKLLTPINPDALLKSEIQLIISPYISRMKIMMKLELYTQAASVLERLNQVIPGIKNVVLGLGCDHQELSYALEEYSDFIGMYHSMLEKNQEMREVHTRPDTLNEAMKGLSLDQNP